MPAVRPVDAEVAGSADEAPGQSWPGGLVLDHAVRAGEDEGFMTVGVPHQIGRGTALAPDLDDLGDALGVADGVAVHMEAIAHRCLHVLTMPHAGLPAPGHS